MKKVMMLFSILMLGGRVWASPLSDLILGSAFIATGGVFEIMRSGEAGNKDDANQKASDANNEYLYNIGGANFYSGSASWEYYQHGNTANYQSLYSTSLNYYNLSQQNLAVANKHGGEASSHNNSEKVYKGVSLTSFSLGSIFIAKACITYWLHKRNSQQASLIEKASKNLALRPANDLTGAVLEYKYRF